MLTPLQNRNSAASIVPLIAKVPGEWVDKVRHITFDSPLDPMAKDMREEAIRRIGLGMAPTRPYFSAWVTGPIIGQLG